MSTADRLAVLRHFTRDYQGDITTGVVRRLYVATFGKGDWRRAARQDLTTLAEQGLLICDTTDPGRTCYRLNYAHGGRL
ncbi:hypothetical protein [Streptomyces sp. NBC_01320]|uniref:hypothetical protein n=1 Tax=Streptomyces sp. NBC_01320 TaxID=2903824 RepID=UPI002E12FFB3|nr:hypothetical protein OG395_35515 [Streptomyces sp. NBC_01320]